MNHMSEAYTDPTLALFLWLAVAIISGFLLVFAWKAFSRGDE